MDETSNNLKKLDSPPNFIETFSEDSSSILTTDENEKSEKFLRLPVSRVKQIMKMDPDVHLASQETVILVTKATELFIQYFAREAYGFTTQSNRKTVQRKDVDEALDTRSSLIFLDGAIDS